MSKEQTLELIKWFDEQIALTYVNPDALKIILRTTLMVNKDQVLLQPVNNSVDSNNN